MGQLSKATQQTASASEELAATSEELSGQAEQLQQSMAFFTIDEELPSAQLRRTASEPGNSARRKPGAAASAPRLAAPTPRSPARGATTNFRPY
jgi:methyl-accepting chemotaxis protein